MVIYYVMTGAVPKPCNPEFNEFGGAYINCWVKAATQNEALTRVSEYIDREQWSPIKTEEAFAAQRSFYLDEPDSLECYDEAFEYGISAIFYTWPVTEEAARPFPYSS